jgi:hypothetical protein
MELQDKIAAYYADVCFINGLGYYDFDGQEFLFNNGHGYYSAKRFFRKMFERAASHGIPPIRFTGATLSEGSWHYQSIWNVGGGKNLYDVETREWGSTTSQGKDLRDVVLNQKDVESCPQKYEIFNTIRTWENARSANAFPGSVKKLLADPERSWKLEEAEEKDTWFLYDLEEGEKNRRFVLQGN